VEWLTKTARAVLPKSFSRNDAIFNIGRAVLVVDALRSGDLDLLQSVMEDRVHQPYRLKHIGEARLRSKCAQSNSAQRRFQGAGPSIIAFVPPEQCRNAQDMRRLQRTRD
jgi:homoserine kinase